MSKTELFNLIIISDRIKYNYILFNS